MKDTREGSVQAGEASGAYDVQPRWKQLAVPLSGHILVGGCALAVLGREGWSSFVAAFADFPLGAASPLGTAQELLQRGQDFARTNTPAAVVALLLLKYSALNLLPLPAFNGWDILRVLAVGGKPRSWFEEKLHAWLLLPMLLLIIGWFVAIGVFVYKSVG